MHKKLLQRDQAGSFDWRKALENRPLAVSAPCRVDMGGTLDIRTFSYPLQHLAPCTVNIALDLRTTVRLEPYARNRVKVSSRGFRSAGFQAARAPFSHPLGLMFAVAACFRAEGLHIAVQSSSPPRSALGGSSVAAVALAAALWEVRRRGNQGVRIDGRRLALLAHAVEESVAGLPCGYQDQLAAVYGGVHAWRWTAYPRTGVFERRRLLPPGRTREIERRFLLAYAGVPHESRDINGRWVRDFISGRNRGSWAEIARLTGHFAEALAAGDYRRAASFMNRETAIRRRMTPDVVDGVGSLLIRAARRLGCGARFTGAGGGGCIWALGEAEAIAALRPRWQEILSSRPGARLLDAPVARTGLKFEQGA
jgi:D-glycero-alpha-D-manno-heptose-7-phosphate kinase